MPNYHPQLVMRRPTLDDLPPIELPDGYEIHHFQPGMDSLWEHIVGCSFESPNLTGRFETDIRRDGPFRPERVLFVFKDKRAVATASAWYQAPFGRRTGYLHYVGLLPEEAGKGLGLQVSLAALHKMVEEGRTSAILHTDDYRTAALKIYLRLGFEPCLVHENQRERWRNLLPHLGGVGALQRFQAILDGPLTEFEGPRANMDSERRYPLRRKFLPDRPHRGGAGGGDMDFMGDESLYKGTRLGTATIAPCQARAGAAMEEPLTITLTAGPAGLPEGASLLVAIRGQSPLGFHHATGAPNLPGNLIIDGPDGCEWKPVAHGYQLIRGCLSEGDVVTLQVAKPADLAWTPLAGRREIKLIVDPNNGEPQQRLPEPLTIEILPKEAVRVDATVPCTRRPGEPLRVLASTRDEFDNRVLLDGAVEFSETDEKRLFALRDGLGHMEMPSQKKGLRRGIVKVKDADLACATNPSLVTGDLQMYVGDLHCHDFLSEAEGYTDAVYSWAREDRHLDFVSVVPQSHGWHDNETWTICKYMAERFLEEGRFVTFLGFEWQHTGYGDKIVHYLGGDQPYLPVEDVRYNNPGALYEAVRRSDATIISHHPAHAKGAWVPMTDFDAVEFDLERVVEIWSMHGNAEGWDPKDRPYRDLDERGLVLNALRKGYRLGFVGGSDTHGARPGGSAKEPCGYWGGLAAIWAEELTRRSLFEAIHNRRTVALTGPRIILKMMVNNAWMGSELPASDEAQIRIDAWTPGEIAKVEIVRNGELLQEFGATGDEFHQEVEDQTGGPAWYYARVTQKDGHLAVCSPVWVG